MWNKVKDWAWNSKTEVFTQADEPVEQVQQVSYVGGVPIYQDKTLVNALAHYCAICNRGFKTVGATNAHKSIKHKPNDN